MKAYHTPKPRFRSPASGEEVERISVSIPAAKKKVLEEMATEKKVSLAWVIRDAIDRYVADSPPAKL